MVSGLEAGGARVMVVKADVSKVEDVARVLEEIKLSGAPLRGIVHAAGVLSQTGLLQLTVIICQDCFPRRFMGRWSCGCLNP